ncbi:DUF5789 family protein [Halobacterium sp. R2-5]|uniref:DUF5789 family protein n=1 Tax=Halobacterium sp. R2-5 TaxID=2715751 RepID=UPI00141F654B|nr:DUF5789 family protein [Halobacterium sp. R2-5]NIB98732.1 hypothetical protein [Halobacterium sp. R2-5]
MADDTEEDEEPAVELGEGESVEGAPLARVASRLTWGQQKSEVIRKEGETVVRTPDGPQTLESILEDVDSTYFQKRQAFVDAVREVVEVGPVSTE